MASSTVNAPIKKKEYTALTPSGGSTVSLALPEDCNEPLWVTSPNAICSLGSVINDSVSVYVGEFKLLGSAIYGYGRPSANVNIILYYR